jgi:hypothetical protein
VRPSLSTNATSIFKDLDVAKRLSNLHDSYVLVQADKAPNKNVSERILTNGGSYALNHTAVILYFILWKEEENVISTKSSN